MIRIIIILAAVYMLYMNFDEVHETLSLKTEDEVKKSMSQLIDAVDQAPNNDHADPIMKGEIDTLRAERRRIAEERYRVVTEHFENNR